MRPYLEMSDDQLINEIDRIGKVALINYLIGELHEFENEQKRLEDLHCKVSDSDDEYFSDNEYDSIEALLQQEIEEIASECLVISDQIDKVHSYTTVHNMILPFS